MQPCCRARKKYDHQSVASFFDSAAMQELRASLASGERHPICGDCWQIEDTGGGSLRQSARAQWKHITPDQKPRLRYLELGLGNVCNNACIMCNSALSSRWINDEKRLDLPPNKVRRNVDDRLFSDTDLSGLVEIRFMGGEPMLYQEEIITILDRSRPKIIAFSTNGSILPNERLLRRFKFADEIKITFSIDAYGPLNELIRFGSRWSSVVDNLRQWATLINTAIFVNTTVQILNVLHLKQLADWVRNEPGVKWWSCWPVDDPTFYDIRILPADIKNLAYERNKSVSSSSIDRIIKNAMGKPSCPELLSAFLERTAKLDKIRKTDTRSVSPEIFDLLAV